MVYLPNDIPAYGSVHNVERMFETTDVVGTKLMIVWEKVLRPRQPSQMPRRAIEKP